MKDDRDITDRLALEIIRVTNPTILGVLLLCIIAATKAVGLYRIVLFESILMVAFVLLPLAYVYLRMRGLINGGRLLFDLTLFLRNHPRDILLMGLTFGLPCLGILIYFGAPPVLIATLTSLLGISLIVAVINLVYRVSYHLSALTAILISAATIWGPSFFIIISIIPVAGWAKYHAHEHTLPQMIMAILLATGSTLTIFSLFGL